MFDDDVLRVLLLAYLMTYGPPEADDLKSYMVNFASAAVIMGWTGLDESCTGSQIQALLWDLRDQVAQLIENQELDKGLT
ncbi:hypothetical protein AHIS2_p008 [Acaryochloris phage A-HIS2]|nr:hypothetical protein AHIS2_p008 [Acaryochloris phage A-HIS2]